MQIPPPSTWLRYILTLAWVAAAAALGAQVTFSAIPTDNQLIARAGDDDGVAFVVQGNVADASGGESVTATLSSAGVVVDSAAVRLRVVGDSAGFGVSLRLPVTRANHTLVVRLDGAVVATVRGLVAGDVFVVNGQSNALGGYSLAEVDRDSFLRGYSPGGGWGLLQFSNPGQWMGRAARQLTLAHDVPVAVFNFAVGAQRLSFFVPGGSGNFEEVRSVLGAAGALGSVRGLCWFQGEADGWEATIGSYGREWSELLDAYRDQLGVAHFYGFQTRTYACGHPEPFVMEAQRRLNRERADLDLVASTNAINDSCHFVYEGGYQVLGDRLADVITLRQYGGSDRGVLSPDVDSARVRSATEIEVYFRDYGAGLAVTGAVWGEFRAEGTGLRAVAGEIRGARLWLTFPGDISRARGLSYLGHAGPDPAALHNGRGVGAFTFYDVSLAPGDGVPGNRPDAELTLRSATDALAVATVFSAEAVVRNTGRASLREFVVSVPLPRPNLIYVGGNEGEASRGRFDPARDRWTVDGLAPGDSAVLRLNYFVADAAGPVTLWAELADAEREDEDSRAGNGTRGLVSEDDEARVVFNDRGRDCAFGVEASAVSCTTDSLVEFMLVARGLPGDERLLLRGAPDGEPRVWLAGEPLSLRVAPGAWSGFDPSLGLALDIEREGDSTCATRVVVALSPNCPLVDVAERRSGEAGARLVVFPNPVVAGGRLQVRLTDSRLLADETPVALFDLGGRQLGATTLARALREGLAAPPVSGWYVLRVGAEARAIVVE